MTDDEIDELVDAWYAGHYPGQELSDVIMEQTGWSNEQFCQWASTGTRPD